jgi:hypothetical protein
MNSVHSGWSGKPFIRKTHHWPSTWAATGNLPFSVDCHRGRAFSSGYGIVSVSLIPTTGGFALLPDAFLRGDLLRNRIDQAVHWVQAVDLLVGQLS